MEKSKDIDEVAEYLNKIFKEWSDDQDDKEDFPLPDVTTILVLSLLSGNDNLLKKFTFFTDEQKSEVFEKIK